MTDAVRRERCAEVAAAVMVLIPSILEGRGDPDKLANALPAVQRIQTVIDAGSAGIDDERYLAWLRVAPANIRALGDAVEAGDADAAFAAFRDPSGGLHLLSAGCEGCVGW
ncbi:hypothetical protein [Leucobacter denitrificans]|uniref:Uncharacterized protein n=1 Tax=Leucobacter denitrificans TaxID=683042 RepID=A0A7G9S4R8_9MICO|nr:hypothetical protein [Leucobacter denitrificans]QNN62843.1 hypothetical protein H9L06_00080 [Leucobacter denitrificans]